MEGQPQKIETWFNVVMTFGMIVVAVLLILGFYYMRDVRETHERMEQHKADHAKPAG